MSKKEIKNKKQNLSFMLLVLLLISAIVCISSFGIATWARYRSTVGNNVVAQIAKWSFKVNNEEEQFADINLADTISFEHVVNTKVAPGTYGSFDLDIDGRGSEVSLDYYISMVVAQKPTNLKFYTDSNYTQEIEISAGNKMFLEGDLLLTEASMQEIKTIYWKWDYRTTTMPSEAVLNSYTPQIDGLQALINQYETAASQDKDEIAAKINDKIDTHEEGGDILVNVTVKGIQINPNFSLKGVKITSTKKDTYDAGDVVNFSMEFTENVYADDNQTAITNATAPQVTVGFAGTSADSPIAKVASLVSTNLNLATGENLATFVGVSGKRINYTYTIKARDRGTFKITNITGNVYNSSGTVYSFGNRVPEIIGETILTDVSKNVTLGNVVQNQDGTYSFPNASISGPESGDLKYVVLQFASGIKSGDSLSISGVQNATANATNTMVSIDVEGKTIEEIEEIIRNNFKVTLASRNSYEEVSIKISMREDAIQVNLNYYSATDHFYEFVSAGGITWEDAKTAAEQRSYMGMQGYLATITSEGEDEFAKSLISGYGWLGGTCDYQYILDSNGNRIYNSMNESLWNWYWVTGPEAGMKFWDKTGNLNAYSKWGSGEPNNNGNEYYLHYYQNNTWNDYANDNRSISGYIVEYGGMPGDVLEEDAADSDVVVIPVGTPNNN